MIGKMITRKWLEEQLTCGKAIKQFEHYEGDKHLIPLLEAMIARGKLDWASWLIVRNMTYRQYLHYACYAARLVLDLYETKYPNDARPRAAIEAAEKCINKRSSATRNAARAAADAAWAAADAAWDAAKDATRDATRNAARAAADAAWAAADAAWDAARDATRDTADAVRAAVRAATWWVTSDAARDAARIEILKYGIQLLQRKGKTLLTKCKK